jgi:uncharacterized protein (DUF2141 family)
MRIRFCQALLWVFLGVLVVAAAEPPPAGGAEEGPVILIRVTVLRSDEGRLVCALFGEENWLRAGAVSGEGGEIAEGTAVCLFRGIEPGTYAISTFHDENSNGSLDTGFMRIPKEGTAASNNAFRRFGPPRYRDANFEYDGGVLELEAEMRYLAR